MCNKKFTTFSVDMMQEFAELYIFNKKALKYEKPHQRKIWSSRF